MRFLISRKTLYSCGSLRYHLEQKKVRNNLLSVLCSYLSFMFIDYAWNIIVNIEMIFFVFTAEVNN